MKPRGDARRYEIGGAWGNSVQWFDVAKRSVVGWKEPRPRVGDILKSPMKSGRIALFVFTEVYYKHDPPDMFFGTVEHLTNEED